MSIYQKIMSLKEKLYKNIDRSSLKSDETREVSLEIDELVNRYYQTLERRKFPNSSVIPQLYENSYEALKSVTLQLEHFPAVEEWNNFAQKHRYLCNVSLEYISRIDWHKLEIKIMKELKTERKYKN